FGHLAVDLGRITLFAIQALGLRPYDLVRKSAGHVGHLLMLGGQDQGDSSLRSPSAWRGAASARWESGLAISGRSIYYTRIPIEMPDERDPLRHRRGGSSNGLAAPPG